MLYCPCKEQAWHKSQSTHTTIKCFLCSPHSNLDALFVALRRNRSCGSCPGRPACGPWYMCALLEEDVEGLNSEPTSRVPQEAQSEAVTPRRAPTRRHLAGTGAVAKTCFPKPSPRDFGWHVALLLRSVNSIIQSDDLGRALRSKQCGFGVIVSCDRCWSSTERA